MLNLLYKVIWGIRVYSFWVNNSPLVPEGSSEFVWSKYLYFTDGDTESQEKKITSQRSQWIAHSMHWWESRSASALG